MRKIKTIKAKRRHSNMKMEKYLETRNQLINEAEGLIEEGKLEESQAKIEEVEQLDNKFEEIKVANANLNALKENEDVTNIENKTIEVEGAKKVESININSVKDEKEVYVEAWAKSLMNQDMSQDEKTVFAKMNNLSNDFTHTTINTPTLIPDTVVGGIEALMEEQYPLLADVRKLNVKGNLKMNRHSSIEAGDAAWYTEPTVVADEENEFNQFTLTGHELAKAVTVSWKLKSMAVSEFIPFIQREIASRMGVALATAVAKGTGTNQPKGIVTVLNAQAGKPQVNEYETLAYEDLTNAVSRIHSSLLGGVAIYASNGTIWNTLANLKDGEGRPLFIPDVTSGGVGRIFGYTVKADGSLSEGDVLFGNADKGYILNTNEALKMVTEDHAKPRETDYVAYGIYDGDVYEPQAFALLTAGEATP